MSARLYVDSVNCQQCPFFNGGRDQSCLAVEGSMRCSLYEIENYCVGELHRACPVYQERMRSQQDVPLEVYEAKLLLLEFHQPTV
jgi:hypothetical protein